MRVIDLSTTIEDGLACDPPSSIPKIEYTKHQDAAAVQSMLGFFPGSTVEDLPDGMGWAFEMVSLGTHTGTHLDAPYHFHPTMDGGERAITIDEVPLEWCYCDAVMLDFSDKEDGYIITPEDLEAKFKEMGYELKPLDIVLVQSGAAPYFGDAGYLLKGCGLGWDSTCWLTAKGVKVAGTDAWSWDPPLPITSKRFAATKNKKLIWEGHKAGMERGYCHMEKLTNLDKLPTHGFKVVCFPQKIKGGSAGWCRPVAFLE